jgi:protein tyrosine phosphatase (PTP) superfamily phosphohydrolase (DUF442 family)
MPPKLLPLLALAFTAGCIGSNPYIKAPVRESVRESIYDAPPPDESAAYQFLAGKDGPVRFARVADGVYRGGQPTRQHLEQLYALGVRTVVNLRREDSDARHREQAECKRLGIRFLNYPFYGVFGADDEFLLPIVAELKKGSVYVHCLHGRDRTSLLVALYRVLVEGWDPHVAWKLEVVDYGSAQTGFYRQLHVAYDRLTREFPPAPDAPLQAKGAQSAAAQL